MSLKRRFSKTVEHLDDLDIIIQALNNTGQMKVAEEIKRLLRLRQIAERAREIQRQREFAKHLKVTGEKHPDDDIPF